MSFRGTPIIEVPLLYYFIEKQCKISESLKKIIKEKLYKSRDCIIRIC
ncbi:hypothetical protein CLD_2901 [Clostridium botulinum B1 str. Okra]|uniref:Uncharacterized protein n=1 Tax=Clostridium botulinum (strain Okra / Type B1) TaxID=498213 RepID=B1ILS5_CLOBK|nr:hypothetical protein CLD_2901 [Clostridium botulinum B1 str. Okra]